MANETRDAPTTSSEANTPRAKRHPNRRCAVCGMKLSLYNPGPHCWQHTIGYPWRGPSAKPRYD